MQIDCEKTEPVIHFTDLDPRGEWHAYMQGKRRMPTPHRGWLFVGCGMAAVLTAIPLAIAAAVGTVSIVAGVVLLVRDRKQIPFPPLLFNWVLASEDFADRWKQTFRTEDGRRVVRSEGKFVEAKT